MYKVIFRVGNEHSYIWKEVEGIFLNDHAQEISRNLLHRHVFNVVVPVDDFTKNGLPVTFELKSANA